MPIRLRDLYDFYVILLVDKANWAGQQAAVLMFLVKHLPEFAGNGTLRPEIGLSTLASGCSTQPNSMGNPSGYQPGDSMNKACEHGFRPSSCSY